VLVLHHCCEQLSKETITTNSNNAVQVLQLIQAQTTNKLFSMALSDTAAATPAPDSLNTWSTSMHR
jgi:hypothetical protein